MDPQDKAEFLEMMIFAALVAHDGCNSDTIETDQDAAYYMKTARKYRKLFFRFENQERERHRAEEEKKVGG